MESSLLQTVLFAMNRPEPIRQASLLMVLASGVGHGDALVEGLRSHAMECGSPWSDRVTALRMLLEQGIPLSSSLRSNSGLLPETVVSAIHVGEQTGTLRDVLADEAQRIAGGSRRSQLVGLSFGNAMLWLAVVGSVMATVVMFLMIYIIPKFKLIFSDFGMEMPRLTTVLLDLSDSLSQLGPLIFMPCLAAVVMLGGLRIYANYVGMSRGAPPGVEHWPRYWVPDVLRMLSLAVAARRPVQETLHCLVSDMRPGRAAIAFSGARYRIETGQDCVVALHDEGLINRREREFLEASSRSGHLDWGLSHLGQAMEGRRLRWFHRFSQLLEPAVILLAGGVVLFITIAMFLPMIELLEHLS